ncbi:MAG: HDIG domain-containing protein [Candidatus Thermoplasmatota archaeon]|nr:HDIG domain-containing protein [Euryarchaeota archaeon]MBU4031520.1 HDIG domain-containing protein [Candidatus Thermoplasmatota archaeon]MBU4072007.1 HDIG domain-containing protein [Candidatus Thermoplasmatota archaeon]MBU4144538.1 HDIG domain-containing protein [Candidatus Thermoplasmatota archaeon]MBU4592087.1 HDIG domain-containing protein [Candidatus Thermoplasmatota archaeon]
MITEKDVEKLFGAYLKQIKNKKMRDMTVKVWVDGCKQGGWTTVKQLEKMPYTLLTETYGINFIEHTIAVTRGAMELAKAQLDTYRKMPYKIDMDRLIVGGLLHDIGKLVETEPDGKGGYRKSHAGKCLRHPVSGTVMVKMAGFSDEIANTIACHAKEGEGAPQCIETVFIHQADFATFNPLVMMNGGKLIQE